MSDFDIDEWATLQRAAGRIRGGEFEVSAELATRIARLIAAVAKHKTTPKAVRRQALAVAEQVLDR